MPRQTGLLCRKGRYYLNLRVPQDLRRLYGNKDVIRKALGTSDYREAIGQVRYRAFEIETEFSEKRRLAKAAKDGSRKIQELRAKDAHELVFKFLTDLEKESEKWFAEEGRKLGLEERKETIKNLRFDQMVYSGGSHDHLAADGSGPMKFALQEQGLECEVGSSAYSQLSELFRRARLENIVRDIGRLNHDALQPHDSLFREVFANSAPRAKSVTLEELVTRRKEALIKLNSATSTLKSYIVPSRLVCEVLGSKTRVEDVTKDDADRLLSLLRRVPANSTQKYPRMTLEAAIEAADREGNSKRLSSKSLENYFNNISSLFNFAVEKEMIPRNPFKDRYMRAEFIGDNEENEKALFTTSELNQLFRTPLYTGCIDDQSGYSRKGQNHPRRGRFWVPLLSLFHGMRCNEAAQLYTEDFCEKEGIFYFEIREARADGSKCEKHLKTKQSKRQIPLHEELIRMGFVEFVQTRQGDHAHPRLFPDLPYGSTGYFSNPFSKWFRRFRTSALSADCKATFHSFRHHFRTALGEVGVPTGDVDMLGGWDTGKRSSEKKYDKPTMTRLKAHIDKVEYPGLDLAHLYTRE